MLARLNYAVRALRVGTLRRVRRPLPADFLRAEGALTRVLQVRRAVGIAAVIGAAGWVLLRES